MAFIRSAPVAPPERFSRPRNLAVLLPVRLAGTPSGDLAGFRRLLALLIGVAFAADLRLDGATWRACPGNAGAFGRGRLPGFSASLVAGRFFLFRSFWFLLGR